MKFILIEENELEKRAKYHRKRQKGLSPFCYLNPNAGNVEKGIEVFNSSANTEGVSLGEAINELVFSYEGPIEKFVGNGNYKYIGKTGKKYFTTSSSKDKAKSNILYQIKNDLGLESFVKIKIDDSLINQESTSKEETKISNEYTDVEYVGNIDGLDIYLDRINKKYDDTIKVRKFK